MKIKTLIKYIFVCLVIVGITGVPREFCCAAPAQSSAQLKQKLRQTNDKRNYLQQQKKNADLRLRREQNKLNSNQQRLEVAHTRLQENTIRYNNLVTNLSAMEVQLNHALAEFQKLDAEMKLRIRQVFMHQRTGMFESILYARDVNALLDIFYFEKIVIMEDYKRIQSLKAKAQHIAALKAQVENQKRMIESSIREINSQRASIQNSIAANKSMIERLKKDKAYYEKAEKELARQSANIQSMIAKLSKNTGGTSQVKITSTGFIRPISGPITSPFGHRIHPIFKSRIFHSGIDIGGPNGGAIRASNDGKVIYSGWYGGYGKVVILDHGVVNGQPITTLYAHMSSIGVSNGQMVKKGQTLGREGSTGYSTGPHCHFEVRVNGKPVNPLNYVR